MHIFANHYVDILCTYFSPSGCCGSVYCPVDTEPYPEEARGAKTGMGACSRKSPAELGITARETCRRPGGKADNTVPAVTTGLETMGDPGYNTGDSPVTGIPGCYNTTES